MCGLRLLTFDVTNTLLRVRGSPGHEYAAVARQLGVNVSGDELDRVYGAVWRQKKLDHPLYGRHAGHSTRQWWADFVRRVFVAAGYRGSDAGLGLIADRLEARFNGGHVWQPLPHALAALEGLRARGLRLGVVSNFDERLERTLLQHHMLHYFDFVVTAVSAGCEKPDPRIFHDALRLARVPPAAAAHVGDDVTNDYICPKAAGMHAFLLDRDGRLRTRHHAEHPVDESCVLAQLSDLVRIIDDQYVVSAELHSGY